MWVGECVLLRVCAAHGQPVESARCVFVWPVCRPVCIGREFACVCDCTHASAGVSASMSERVGVRVNVNADVDLNVRGL